MGCASKSQKAKDGLSSSAERQNWVCCRKIGAAVLSLANTTIPTAAIQDEKLVSLKAIENLSDVIF